MHVLHNNQQYTSLDIYGINLHKFHEIPQIVLGNVVVYALCNEEKHCWQHLVQTRITGQDLESGGSSCWISTHACLQDHLEVMKEVFLI